MNTLTMIVGEARNSESLAEKIERLESEIESLKEDLETERQRGDEQYDRAEKLEEKYSHITDEEAEYLEDHDFQTMKETYDKWLNDELVEVEADDNRRVEIAKDLKSSYERLSMGVNSEIDTIIELTNELIELHE